MSRFRAVVPTITARFRRLTTEHDATGITYGMVRAYIAHHRRRQQRSELSQAHQAIADYDLLGLRTLLDSGTAIDETDHHGRTLLHHALDVEHARHTEGEPLHADITVLLLIRGATLRSAAYGRMSALDHALRLDHWLAAEVIQARKENNRW